MDSVEKKGKQLSGEEVAALKAKAWDVGMLLQEGKDEDGVDWGHLNYALATQPYGEISIIGRNDLRQFWPHAYRVIARLLDGIEAQQAAYAELIEDVRVWRAQAIETTTAARYYKGALVELGVGHEEAERGLADYNKYLDTLAEKVENDILAAKNGDTDGQESK